jgi:hypothetical protein
MMAIPRPILEGEILFYGRLAKKLYACHCATTMMLIAASVYFVMQCCVSVVAALLVVRCGNNNVDPFATSSGK